MNYVWRTNDIVYLPDAPRGRPGGQYFPRPMVEKNGSNDAFRFFVHRATGGSDHICFNNPSVGVPGIELFTWPDQWYHADADTPDKSDPTQMKRDRLHRRRRGVGRRPTAPTRSLPGLPRRRLELRLRARGRARSAEGDADLLRMPTRWASPVPRRGAQPLDDFAVNREVGAMRSIDGS